MKKITAIAVLFVLWASLTGLLAYGAYVSRHNADAVPSKLAEWKHEAATRADFISLWTKEKLSNAEASLSSAFAEAGRKAGETVRPTVNAGLSALSSLLDVHEHDVSATPPAALLASASPAATPVEPAATPVEPVPLTLTEMKRRSEEAMEREAMMAGQIEPAAQNPAWDLPQEELEAQAVLVPAQVTVVSSAQDGRIADMPFTNGDRFKAGDVLVAYDCAELEAEADIVRMQKALTGQKAEGSDRLFKLDIISDLDRLGALVEDRQAAAKTRLYRARLEDCAIKARFDGRVTNRLANPGEYTRTDRVLLEVASLEPLKAEFLIPSKWLRWINVGAPVSILLSETEQTYTARVVRIHGEVDPVSQSIQVVAALDPYQDPLLPGMSGKAVLRAADVQAAGISGFLQRRDP